MKRRSFLTGLLAAPAAPVVAKVFVQAKEAVPAVTPPPIYRFGPSTVEAMDGSWVTACASRHVPTLDDWETGFDDEYQDDDE